jgi:signal transduction histidine kinase
MALAARPLTLLAVLLAVTAATAATRPAWAGFYLLIVAGDLAAGWVAATRRPGVTTAAAAVTLGVQLAVLGARRTGASDFRQHAVVFALTLGAAVLLGRWMRERRRLAAAVGAQAVAAERLQIARELHDMIAHSIGVIAIQAGAGRRLIDTQPDQARDALSTIEDTSRETLAALRRTVSALRRAETADVPLGPAPGLADLGRLVSSTLAAGVRVEVRRRGTPRPVPADIDLAAFRIIQEALTNVVRHADTRSCRVTLGYHDAELAVEVDDDGPSAQVPPAGHGITGMRERAALLNGRFTAGPRSEGGFRVAAYLPLPGAAR